MKYRFIIDCESTEYQPTVNVTGEIAGGLARVLLPQVTVTRLHIAYLDEPQAELIAADQCACLEIGN